MRALELIIERLEVPFGELQPAIDRNFNSREQGCIEALPGMIGGLLTEGI